MKTILIVDDEFDMISTLRAILEGEGYRVETCSNGKEALDRLAALQPDLVLMDVMMPILGGQEALKALRQRPECARLPVALMSSALPPAAAADGAAWQAFLRKPFTLEVLLKTVRGLAGDPG